MIGNKKYLYALVVILSVSLVFTIGFYRIERVSEEETPLEEGNDVIPSEEWNSPPNPTIMEGSGVQDSVFTVFQDNEGTTYLKNGWTGEVTGYSDDNTALTVAMENAFLHEGGGQIHVKSGNYTVNGLRVKSGVRLKGDSLPSTVFYSTGTYGLVVDNKEALSMTGFTVENGGINIEDSSSIGLRDLYITGADNALRLCGSEIVSANHIVMENFSEHALCLGNNPSTEKYSHGIVFSNVIVREPQSSVEKAIHIVGNGQGIEKSFLRDFVVELDGKVKCGLYVENTGGDYGDITVDGFGMGGATDTGVHLINAPNHVLSDVRSEGDNYGYRIEHSDDTNLQMCSITPSENSPQVGVKIEDSSGCVLNASSFRGMENKGVWVENCYHVNLTSNNLFGAKYGVYAENTSGVISGNDVTESSVDPIVRLDSENITVNNNFGYVLKNFGTATMLNGDKAVVIQHGLDELPEAVNIQPKQETSKDFYFRDINEENLEIVTGSTVNENIDLSWTAEAS